MAKNQIKVALIGNPNTGKTSLFNQLTALNQKVGNYPGVTVDKKEGVYIVETNKNNYQSKIVILALDYSKPFTIKGFDDFLIPHKKSNPEKDRIQLKNNDHFIKKGLYCSGTIAGHRSQFAIAAGSGASVATDILTLWNGGKHTKIHDKI